MAPDAISAARRALATIFWAAILAAPTACDPAGPEAAGPIDDDAYVMVMSELADIRRFPPGGRTQTARDSAADAARQAVLDRHGVTVDELLSFAEIVGEQPARMVEISERISAVTDSLAELRRTGDRTGAADTAGLAGDSAELSGRAADTVDAVAGSTEAVAGTTEAVNDGPADTVRDADDEAAPQPDVEGDEALRERIERFRERREEARP